MTYVSPARFSAQPGDTGLYRREFEHDACGVAMVATLRGTPGHDIIDHALTALRNLEHRGATGADPLVGDGAGILTQIPDAFLREVVDFDLPVAGAYAVGTAFLPTGQAEREAAVAVIEAIAAEEGLRVLGWREVPVDPELVGQAARDCMPLFRQLFVPAPAGRVVGIGLDRLAFCLRKRAEREAERLLPVAVRRAPSSTRACSRPASSSRSSPTCRTGASRPSSRWCTRASPRTPSPPGRWPTPTG